MLVLLFKQNAFRLICVFWKNRNCKQWVHWIFKAQWGSLWNFKQVFL